MQLPAGIVQDSEIKAAITRVCQELAPDVKRILFNFGSDWSGDDAVYFRILISDDAANTRLRETMKKAISMLESSLDLWQLGFFVYYNVRSESEQDVLREKSWAQEDALS
jgi:hypothetical protein